MLVIYLLALEQKGRQTRVGGHGPDVKGEWEAAYIPAATRPGWSAMRLATEYKPW